MSKHRYDIEMLDRDQWVVIDRDVRLEWGKGWVDCYRSRPGPSPAVRLVRRDETGEGRLMEEVRANPDLSCGAMPASIGHQWPYVLNACVRALKRAAADMRGAPHAWAEVRVPEVEELAQRVEGIRDEVLGKEKA